MTSKTSGPDVVGVSCRNDSITGDLANALPLSLPIPFDTGLAFEPEDGFVATVPGVVEAGADFGVDAFFSLSVWIAVL